MSVIAQAVWSQARTRHKGFTLVEMLVVVVILAVLAAAVIMVIPRAAQRSREAALRTQLAELQGAVDRYQAERNQPPHGGWLYGLGGLPADPDLLVWVQEGRRRLGDVAQPPYYVWTVDWYALLDGGYVRWWPNTQILGMRSGETLAAANGGTGDLVYALALASPPDAPGDWTTYAYRVCAIPMGYLAQAVNDGSRIAWALDCYRQESGTYPDSITDYQTLRAVVRPWLALPASPADNPWDFVAYAPDSQTGFRLTVYYRYGPYKIVGTSSGVSVVPR